MTACRFFGSVVFALVVCTTGFGQSSFQGITPGESSRDQVESVLGRIVRVITSTRFEYKPPAGIAKVEVEYQLNSGTVERIEVYFIKPITRAALVQKLNLPPQADARKPNAEGNLVEYFGGSSLLALTYATADAGGGISRVGYYSQAPFARAAGLPPPASGRAGLELEKGTALDGTNLTYYPSASVDQCRSDCASNAQCRGFTWIAPGTYNPGDSAMCYLLSAVTKRTRIEGHTSGVKR